VIDVIGIPSNLIVGFTELIRVRRSIFGFPGGEEFERSDIEEPIVGNGGAPAGSFVDGCFIPLGST
jgi:hypothetical protein